jgi:hypothetical protein
MSKQQLDNFDIRAKKPLDKRNSVQNLSEVDLPYEGLRTYQGSDGELYIYKNGTWNPYTKPIYDQMNNVNSTTNTRIHTTMNNIVSDLIKRINNGEISSIEFIGDSITEGYGAQNHVQSTVNSNNGNQVIFNDNNGTVWYEPLFTDNTWVNLFRKYMQIPNIIRTIY